LNVSIQIANGHLLFLLGYLVKLTITTAKKRRRQVRTIVELFGIFIKENPIVVRKPSSNFTLLTTNSPWIEHILCGQKPAVIYGTWHMACYSLCVARTFFFYISCAANSRAI
jgi:hypothetical protein